MRKWLLAWWFIYAITNAQGQPVLVQLVPNWDSEVTCNRVRGATQDFLTRLIHHLQGWGTNFGECLPDSVDKRPR